MFFTMLHRFEIRVSTTIGGDINSVDTLKLVINSQDTLTLFAFLQKTGSFYNQLLIHLLFYLKSSQRVLFCDLMRIKQF